MDVSAASPKRARSAQQLFSTSERARVKRELERAAAAAAADGVAAAGDDAAAIGERFCAERADLARLRSAAKGLIAGVDAAAVAL